MVYGYDSLCLSSPQEEVQGLQDLAKKYADFQELFQVEVTKVDEIYDISQDVGNKVAPAPLGWGGHPLPSIRSPKHQPLNANLSPKTFTNRTIHRQHCLPAFDCKPS